MFQWFLKHTIGTKHERDIKGMRPMVARINDLEGTYESFTDSELREQTDEFKKRLSAGETLDELLPEAFAVVREAAKRVVGMRHFDVQLMGGVVLHQGKIAEMKTGEGKTLVATLAVYLNALTEKGVHIVTVNDYLAKRDANWMRPVYELLGLTVGIIQHDMDPDDRKAAYQASVTYGTNNEFGFDYLRDNMVLHKEERTQRPFHFAIVDEVDSILIDEARTPLIISGPAEESTEKYYIADKKVVQLMRDNRELSQDELPEDDIRSSISGQGQKNKPGVTYTKYYELDEKNHNVVLTEEGNQRIEELLGQGNLYDPQNIEYVHSINQALRAHTLFHRDVNYMVRDGEVVIVDEFTGRLMPGRRYSDGLHQALEAKEGVNIAEENQTLASITFQNLFRKYEKLSGMTGTADTEAVEFKKIYNLDVVIVPTNEPMIRKDMADRVYRTETEKFSAIIEEVKDCHLRNQPVLVGTISIEKSEQLGQLLKKEGIPHNILNAKHHEKEAEIIAEAGKPGKVTIATNMAGRGTDIVLGGSKGFEELLEQHIPINTTVEDWKVFKESIKNQDWSKSQDLVSQMIGQDAKIAQRVLDQAQVWIKDHEKVKAAGGLHILATERHESRRIDNQLRGRSGRQGDSGSSRFYLSLEDNLMRIFGSDKISGIMQRMGMEEGQEIEHPWVTKAIQNAQKRVESHNFDIRKHLLEYDEAMNIQREKIYELRNQALDNDDINSIIQEYVQDVGELVTERFCPFASHVEDWDLQGLVDHFRSQYQIDLDVEQNNPVNMRKQDFSQIVVDQLRKGLERKAETLGGDYYLLQRMVLLQVLDNKWKEHLHSMDQLREGIWTASYSERNPVVEYKRQGFQMFQSMIEEMKEEILEILMRVEIEGELDESDFFSESNMDNHVELREAILPIGQGNDGGDGNQNSTLAQSGFSIDNSSVSSSGTYRSNKKNNSNKDKSQQVSGGTKRKKTRRSRARQ